MPHPRRHWAVTCSERVLWVTLLLLIAGVVPARAQQAGQDTIKTREERIRDRLRAIGPLIRDTAADTLAQDSLAADTTAEGEIRRRGPQGSLSVQRDSMMMELLTLEDYIVTEYKGEHARFEADSGRLDLRINAEVLENGQLLKADSSITYWENRNLACANGNPEVSGTGTAEPILGDSLCYNTQTRIGFVRGARTTVSEGANWRIHGDFVFVDENNAGYGHDAIFTDCDLEEPHYHFAAKDMKVLRGNVIVARNVTMKFRDVPVFWLPFFVQSLERGRQSGLLFPGFQLNDVVRTSSGYERRIEDVGFYWAVNDYMGAEIALDWFSNNWTAVRGSFDYRILNKFLQGGATIRQYWRTGGQTDFTLSTQNSWEANERTRLSLSGSYASSSDFVRENTFDPREINQSISSNAGISRRFDWGTLNLTASRQQYLSSDQVTQTLPSLGLSIASVTLFPALPGEEKWYSNATWTADFNGNRRTQNPGDRRSETNRGTSDMTGRLGSSFSLGNFSVSQSVDLSESVEDTFSIASDTFDLQLGKRTERRMTWSTSMGYQQRLIGTSTITPSLGLSGELLQGDTTGGQRIAAPTRVNFGASLHTDMFGFLPGIGPVERMRHKVSPSLSYRYSPAPNVTDRQRQYFRLREIREQNEIQLSLSQTFEAKIRQREDTTAEDVEQDTVSLVDTTRTGGPRRIPRNEAITILSLNTSAVAYDFVQAREEGDGFTTASITNSITSELLRGLQLSITHDLFEELERPSTGDDDPVIPERRFKPALTSMTASFSLNSDSWLIQKLGLGGRPEEPDTAGVDSLSAADSLAVADTLPGGLESGTGAQRQGEQFGLIGSGRRQTYAQRGAIGTWNANFNYSLTRSRDREGLNNQQLTATASFQPTENWALNWSTGYSFTTGEFTDHVLTLTRSLHDWDANFDFVKAQNGNFSFQFRVALRANQDIKLDYEQRDRQPLSGVR